VECVWNLQLIEELMEVGLEYLKTKANDGMMN
jgi:hypothetical protein